MKGRGAESAPAAAVSPFAAFSVPVTQQGQARQYDCRNRSWLTRMFDWARHRSRLRNCSAPIPRCAPPAAAQQHGGNSHAPLRPQINSSTQWYAAVQRG